MADDARLTLKGRRLPDFAPFHEMEPGDYCRSKAGGLQFVTPNGLNGRIDGRWSLTEHEDQTITVSPSIDVNGGDSGRWHGFLVGGFWRLA